MSNEVINPYQTFYDKSGAPLANGTISFLVNLDTPLGTIFSDEALTVAQANPYTLDATGRIAGDVKYVGLRTLLIKTELGATVRTIDNVATVLSASDTVKPFTTVANMVADTNLLLDDWISVEDYATGNDSGYLFFKVVAAATGTADGGSFIDLPNTTPALQAKQNFPGAISVKAFGAIGSGNASTDDTAEIQAAAAYFQSVGGGDLIFPPGIYNIFSATTGNLCSLSGIDGINILGYGATLQVHLAKTIISSEGILFKFDDCKTITVDGFNTDGPTLDVSGSAVLGYEFVRCVNGCRDISMPNNTIKNMIAGFIASKLVSDPESMRSQNIHIGVMNIFNCWYGCNGQFSGDNLVVDVLRTDTIHRSFFFFGASHLTAHIWSKDHKANVDVPVTTLAGLTVEDINIFYHQGTDSNDCGPGPAIKIGWSDEVASIMRNVNIHLNIEYATSGTTGAAAVFIEKLATAGGPDSGDRGHIMENLKISGVIEGTNTTGSGFSIGMDTLATWGGGDFFRNISLQDLRINGVDSQARIRLFMKGLQDQMLIKNVTSNFSIRIEESQTLVASPSTGKIKLVNVICSNRFEFVAAETAQPLDHLRATTGTPITVDLGWAERTFTNAGLGGSGVWNLPAAVVGLEYMCMRTDAFAFDLNPDGSEIIRGGTAGQALRLNGLGDYVHLKCFIDGFWEQIASQGTFAFV